MRALFGLAEDASRNLEAFAWDTNRPANQRITSMALIAAAGNVAHPLFANGNCCPGAVAGGAGVDSLLRSL